MPLFRVRLVLLEKVVLLDQWCVLMGKALLTKKTNSELCWNVTVKNSYVLSLTGTSWFAW